MFKMTLSDGAVIRTSSNRRFVIFAFVKYTGHWKASARSDNLRTITDRFHREFQGYRRVLVDTVTGTIVREV
jgi:hypothetical protein